MVKATGKTFAYSSVGLGLAVMILTGLVLKDRIVEGYSIQRLKSTDPEEREDALEKLGRIGSAWALRVLLEASRDGNPGMFVSNFNKFRINRGSSSKTIFPLSEGSGNRFFFSPDGKMVLGGQNLSLRSWDASTGRANLLIYAYARGDGTFVFSTLNPPVFSALENITQRLGRAAVPHLVRALEDENYSPRWLPAILLGKLGTKAEEALPILEKLSKNTGGDDHDIFEDVLKKIRGGNEEPK